jgi:hypothetical protein
MLVGYRFPFKTLDVNKIAVIIIRGITLAAHTARAMPV